MRDPVRRYITRLRPHPPSVQIRRVKRRLRAMPDQRKKEFLFHPAVQAWITKHLRAINDYPTK